MARAGAKWANWPAAEIGKVVRHATGDDVSVHNNRLIVINSSGVSQIILQAQEAAFYAQLEGL